MFGSGRKYCNLNLRKIKKNKNTSQYIIILVQIGPQGWESLFVATKWRPQGVLFINWQNPTFTEEGFCYKMAIHVDPWLQNDTPILFDSHPLARFALYKIMDWLYSHSPRIPRQHPATAQPIRLAFHFS